MRYVHQWGLAWMYVSWLAIGACAAEEPVSYDEQIAPVFDKYCSGCHNDAAPEAEFSLESYASLQKGLSEGPAVLPGDAQTSRLWQVLSGIAEPAMPPEGEPAPSESERALIKQWINEGAKGPKGVEPDRLMLRVPHIESQTDRDPVAALDFSPDGRSLAVARSAEVDIYQSAGANGSENPFADLSSQPLVISLRDFPGKVTAVHFSKDGQRLVTASGVAGAGGLATLWELPSGNRIRDFKGHFDLMYDAELSPDGKTLATCSYDRQIILWNAETGEALRTLSGHNGAVFDIAFNPDGTALASASADDTCKVWRVSDGERLDTLGQPLLEQYSIAFSPDGNQIVAGGADNRIRVWQFVSRNQSKINPLAYARFGHEAAIVRLQFTPDGSRLVSLAEDRTVKVWETATYTELELIEHEPDVPAAVAVNPSGQNFMVGRLDGSTQAFSLPKASVAQSKMQAAAPAGINSAPEVPDMLETLPEMAEAEPNNSVAEAQSVSVPGRVKGVIQREGAEPDADYLRIHASAGEEWVIEVNAARSGSELDSLVEILDVEGEPVPRVLLQAVRDSYMTFRGRDGYQSDDFRLFNYLEMELNELVYMNGEVIKLWMYPRGPDSGFTLYPGTGQRWDYFDTTGLSHPLGEPCYVVEPHPPGTELIANGLPVFPVYYRNDDESRRELGKDSRLFFTAPADGDYIIRLRDVRGEQGPAYTYQLDVRPARRDFQIRLAKDKLTVFAGSGADCAFQVDRKDQFNGPITIEVQNLPPGLKMHSPLVIQPEQIGAVGSLLAAADAATPSADQLQAISIMATATIDGQAVSHVVQPFSGIEVKPNPKVTMLIEPAEGGAQPLPSDGDGPLEFVIHPGETIMMKVHIQRHGYDGEVSYGNEGRNLPHGVYVDNIGLNGLLLLSDMLEREFYITAAEWAPEQTREFHLETYAADGHTTPPVILHVRPRESAVAETP